MIPYSLRMLIFVDFLYNAMVQMGFAVSLLSADSKDWQTTQRHMNDPL